MSFSPIFFIFFVQPVKTVYGCVNNHCFTPKKKSFWGLVRSKFFNYFTITKKTHQFGLLNVCHTIPS